MYKKENPLQRMVYNDRMFHAYILRCADGTFYAGCTNDLEKRVHQHNHAKAGAHYTKSRRPVVLGHKDSFRTLAKARAREAALPRMSRAEKLAMMAKNHSVKNRKERAQKVRNESVNEKYSAKKTVDR